MRLGAPLRWEIEASDYANNVEVILPSGGRKSLDPPRADGDRFVVQMRETRAVGFHTVELVPETGESHQALFAVVGDPEEGDLQPVPHADLLTGIDPSVAERVRVERAFRTSKAMQSTSAQEIWQAVLWMLLLVLVCESLWARRMGKRGT